MNLFPTIPFDINGVRFSKANQTTLKKTLRGNIFTTSLICIMKTHILVRTSIPYVEITKSSSNKATQVTQLQLKREPNSACQITNFQHLKSQPGITVKLIISSSKHCTDNIINRNRIGMLPHRPESYSENQKEKEENKSKALATV